MLRSGWTIKVIWGLPQVGTAEVGVDRYVGVFSFPAEEVPQELVLNHCSALFPVVSHVDTVAGKLLEPNYASLISSSVLEKFFPFPRIPSDT